ncbi:bifunctional diguanylate cyclase/phosphodiesterase [Olsenella porci]|nr:EAL domain-containing protein [Olsenella porci]
MAQRVRPNESYVLDRLSQALEEGWIRPYFQPVQRTLTGRICGMEALARWDDPTYGLLSPAAFVPVLERRNLIWRMDLKIVSQVAHLLGTLLAEDRPVVPVSVNLSRIDFHACDMLEKIDGVLQREGVPRVLLNIELTESALADDEVILRESARFRKRGYELWLDDFGSGYSSLNTLKDTHFDVLKIDMEFLREFDSMPQSRVIISSIVNMAKYLHIGTLCEGVETEEQRNFLLSVGCEQLQGYLISKPRPLEGVIHDLQSGSIELETSNVLGYYTRIGKVNTLAANPLQLEDAYDPLSIGHSGSLCIIELQQGDAHVLFESQVFANLLAMMGVMDKESLENLLNDPDDRVGREALNIMRTSARTDLVETAQLVVGEREYAFSIRHIVSQQRSSAFAVSASDITDTARLKGPIRTRTVTNYLMLLFEQIDIFDLDSDTATYIYRSTSNFPHHFKGRTPQAVLRDIGARFVHPLDKERFGDFTDLSTIDGRLDRAKGRHLSDAFRILERETGRYAWKTFTFAPAHNVGHRFLVFTARPTNQEVVSHVSKPGELVSSRLLWDTLVRDAPLGLFWKDAERRFIGASQEFLDFYGFESEDAVVGKTDEDMGWHPDPGPFERDEEAIITRGARTRNVAGTCMVNGEVHHIRASKMPLISNGTIKGLVGYFIDLDSDTLKLSGERSLLLGARGSTKLTGAAAAYQDAWRHDQIPFALIVMSIDSVADFNLTFGPVLLDHLVKKVGSCVAQVVDVHGAWDQIGRGKFCVLVQCANKEQADRVAAQLRQAVASISQVDGIQVSVRCTTGIARSQESDDLEQMERIADRRLREAISDRVVTTRGLSREDVIRRMTVLGSYFDAVRLVDPSVYKASSPNSVSSMGVSSDCFDIWGQDRCCKDCVSQRAVDTGAIQQKYMAHDGKRYLVRAFPVVVDDKSCAIEVMVQLPEGE